MNDTDEDPEALKRVNDRNGVAGSLSPPHADLLSPASLYLTAIIECVDPFYFPWNISLFAAHCRHICECVLGNAPTCFTSSNKFLQAHLVKCESGSRTR